LQIIVNNNIILGLDETIYIISKKNMSELPKVFKKGSMRFDVEKGKTYHWCACGLSANQPFCDGSHKGTEFSPMQYTASDDKTVGFCGCKYSKNKPLCDGSHKLLETND
jgi:CDGSH-type Zn-finger protein